MAEQTPPGDPAEGAGSRHITDSGQDAAGRTPGGYAYTVVNDAEGIPDAAPVGDRAGMRRPGARLPALLVAAAIVPATVVGIAVWLLASSGGGGSGRVNADVSNVINAFSQGSSGGGTSTRYEGKLPPGYPTAIPSYPGGRLVSSVSQISGNDAGYLAIYDTTDARQKVAEYFGKKLDEDPWQVEGSQDARQTALHQFSSIDDANITGLVLAAESQEDRLTTIVVSVQVSSGAAKAEKPVYTPVASRALPEGFPDDRVSPYPEATLIESAYQKAAGGRQFTLSFITRDDVAQVVSYYRDHLTGSGLQVQDADAGQSALADAQAVQFVDASNGLGGEVTAGKFAEDDSYTRIDVRVQAPNSN